jgi:hypothetical protein
MGRPRVYTSDAQRKAKAIQYARLYKEKQWNILHNIVEYCEICDKHLVVDPFKEHRCVFITTTNERIIFD